MNARPLLGIALIFAACTSKSEKAWHRGALAFADAYARSGDPACHVEPQCMQAIQALSGIPADAPQHALAAALLGRIEDARHLTPGALSAGERAGGGPGGAGTASGGGADGAKGPASAGGATSAAGATSAEGASFAEGSASDGEAASRRGAASTAGAAPGNGTSAGARAGGSGPAAAGGATRSERAVAGDALPQQGTKVASLEGARPRETQERSAPPRRGPVQLRGWRNDAAGYRAALRAHQRESRPLVLYFCEDKEQHCSMLDRMFEDARVKRALGSAERVRIAPGRSAADHAVARRYDVRGYPTLLLIPAGSDQPVRLHPFTSRVDGEPRLEAAEDFAADLTRALR